MDLLMVYTGSKLDKMFQGYVTTTTLCHFKVMYTYFVIFCSIWALKWKKKKIKEKSSEDTEGIWCLFSKIIIRKKPDSPKLTNISPKFFDLNFYNSVFVWPQVVCMTRLQLNFIKIRNKNIFCPPFAKEHISLTL